MIELVSLELSFTRNCTIKKKKREREESLKLQQKLKKISLNFLHKKKITQEFYFDKLAISHCILVNKIVSNATLTSLHEK